MEGRGPALSGLGLRGELACLPSDVFLSLTQVRIAFGLLRFHDDCGGWLGPKVAMATVGGDSCLGCSGWLAVND